MKIKEKLKQFDQFVNEARPYVPVTAEIPVKDTETVTIPKEVDVAVRDANKLQKKIDELNAELKENLVKLGHDKTVLMDYLKKIDQNSLRVRKTLLLIKNNTGRTTYPYKEGKEMFEKALATVNKKMADTVAQQFELLKKINPGSRDLLIGADAEAEAAKNNEALIEGMINDIGNWLSGWITKFKNTISSWGDSIKKLDEFLRNNDEVIGDYDSLP